MSITLDSLVLPEDLHWSDEFDWTPVVQRLARFENGVLLREESAVVAGQPITLEGDERCAWAQRGLVKQLALTQADAGAPPMTLIFHGREFSVIWRREGGTPPMTARPAVRPGISDPEDGEWYSLILRFITV